MKKTVGIMFSGYGEQFVTMGKDLYDESRHVQDLFEQASMCLDINFVQLCFASSDAEISEIDKGYLAILLYQISFYSQLAEIGFKPDFIAGFGIGEFAAAVASGSLSFADGLYLLSKYAKFLKEFFALYPHYAVLSLPRGFTKESLEELCHSMSVGSHQQVFISAHTTEHGFYVAGHAEIIEQIKAYCKDHEIRKVKEFSAAYGLHSPVVDSIPAMLSPYLHKIDFKPLKFPVITNADGAYVTSQASLESALLRQINSPILWDEVMHGFVGCEVLICFGPGKQLEQWVQLKYPDKIIFMVEKLADIKKIKEFLEQQDILAHDYAEHYKEHQIEFGQCHLDDIIAVPADLTIADEINELPTDYDIDEDEGEE